MAQSSPRSRLDELQRLGFTPSQITEIVEGPFGDCTTPVNVPSVEFEGLVDRAFEADREKVLNCIRDCESLRNSVSNRPLDHAEILSLRNVVEIASNSRRTAQDVVIAGSGLDEEISGETADRYFLRELPTLLFRAARKAETSINLPAMAAGWQIVGLFKDAESFWLSLAAAVPAVGNTLADKADHVTDSTAVSEFDRLEQAEHRKIKLPENPDIAEVWNRMRQAQIDEPNKRPNLSAICKVIAEKSGCSAESLRVQFNRWKRDNVIG